MNFWCLKQFNLSNDEGLNFIFLLGICGVIRKAWAGRDPHFIQSFKFTELMKTNISWMDSQFNLVKSFSSQLDRSYSSCVEPLQSTSLIFLSLQPLVQAALNTWYFSVNLLHVRIPAMCLHAQPGLLFVPALPISLSPPPFFSSFSFLVLFWIIMWKLLTTLESLLYWPLTYSEAYLYRRKVLCSSRFIVLSRF